MARKRRGIRAEGLPSYLFRTKDKHNNYAYETFKMLYGLSENNKTLISRAFKVSRDTARNWVKIHEEEQQALMKRKPKKR